MDVTYNFTPGTRAVAQQVNQNFADVKSAVDPLQVDVSNIKTQLTSGIVLPDGTVDFTRLQSYKTYTVSNATNATPIVITAVAHGFLTGDKVYISGVGGNTAANGLFTITKVGVDTFTLDGSVGNATYTSGGVCVLYSVSDKNIPSKVYVDTKYINNLGTRITDINLETGKVTLADISGAINLVMPSDLPTGVEHTAIINFTTTLTSSPTILQTTTTKTITNATNASPIVITAVGHGYITGDKVVISGVGGNTSANGTWVITKLTDNTFSLNSSSGNAAYTIGGTVRKANFKWSDKNSGKAPTAYIILSGIRNILVFKTHDGGTTWEAEYTTYGGVETIFVTPNGMSTNGSTGGSSFALETSTPIASYDAWRMFDGSASTEAQWQGLPQWFTFYNPNALKLNSLTFLNRPYNQTNISITAYTVYGSNDNLTWTSLGGFTNSVTADSTAWTTNINSTQFYKYHKIYMSNSQIGTYVGAAGLTIGAVYIAT